MSKLPNRQGRCFDLAYSAILDPKNENAVLVHGTAVARGRDLPSRRIAHAWRIVEDVAVWEPVLDRLLSRDQYYQVFSAIEVRCYSPIQAAETALAARTLGRGTMTPRRTCPIDRPRHRAHAGRLHDPKLRPRPHRPGLFLSALAALTLALGRPLTLTCPAPGRRLLCVLYSRNLIYIGISLDTASPHLLLSWSVQTEEESSCRQIKLSAMLPQRWFAARRSD